MKSNDFRFSVGFDSINCIQNIEPRKAWNFDFKKWNVNKSESQTRLIGDSDFLVDKLLENWLIGFWLIWLFFLKLVSFYPMAIFRMFFIL